MILKTTSVYSIYKCTKCKEREPHNARAATAGFVQLNFHCPPFGRNENLVIGRSVYCIASFTVLLSTNCSKLIIFSSFSFQTWATLAENALPVSLYVPVYVP